MLEKILKTLVFKYTGESWYEIKPDEITPNWETVSISEDGDKIILEQIIKGFIYLKIQVKHG